MQMETRKLVPAVCALGACIGMSVQQAGAQTAPQTNMTTLPPLPASQRIEPMVMPPNPVFPTLTHTTSESGPATVSLQGTVTRQAVPAASLSATIDAEVKRKFKGPQSKFVAVTLHLTNPNADSVILDGDKAVAYYGEGAQATNASEQQAIDDAAKTLGMTTREKLAVSTVTVATLTLGGQLFYEWIQGGATNPKLSLGRDEVRRRIEGVRLGDRLMLPNETADGTVFLPEAEGMPKQIVIPVLTYPARQSAGVLRVDIGSALGAGTSK